MPPIPPPHLRPEEAPAVAAHELDVLAQLARAAREATTAAAIEAASVHALRDALAIDMVALAQISPDGTAAAGALTVADDLEVEVPCAMLLDERPSALARVVATGRPLHVADARSSHDTGGHLPSRFNAGSISYLPIAWGGQVRYVAILIRHQRQTFSPGEIRLAQALADVGSGGFARVEAVSRDPLTRLLNHGGLFAALDEEVDRARAAGRPFSALMLDLDDFELINDRHGHLAGDETLREVAGTIVGLLRDGERAARYGGDEFVVVLPGMSEAQALVRAAHLQATIVDRLPPGTACSIGVAQWSPGVTPTVLIHHADRALMRAKRSGKCTVHTYSAALGDALAIDGHGAVQALAAAIEARDNYTHEHSTDVVRLADAVADAMRISARERERIRRAALLHDVGKLAIPNDILHKPGPLTDAEWELMAQHPVIGERILARAPELSELAPIVRHEHEHWDGSGYPDGLAGDAIPIASRIILACDAYNAMRTDRPYRSAMSHEAAIAELHRGAGRQFDPAVVAALVRRLAAPL